MPALKASPLNIPQSTPAQVVSSSRLRGIQPTPGEPAATEDLARYISQMTAEMAAIARSANLDLLAYFLEMAKIEANVTARRAMASEA